MNNPNEKTTKRLTGAALFTALIISVIWGFSYTAMDILLEAYEPVQIMTLRWMVAALLYVIPVLAGKIRFRFRGKAFKWLLLTALAEPCLYAVFETYGVKYTSASVSAVMIATIPAMTLITGVLFFKGRATVRGIAGIVLAFLGVIICTVFLPGASGGGMAVGLVSLLAAVFTGSLYTHFSAKAGEEYSAMSITAFMAFASVPWYAALNHLMGYGTATYTKLFSDPKLIAGILFLGVLCSAVCYQGYNYVLQHSPDTSTASNIVANLVTVSGVVIGILFRHDPAGWFTPVGLVITLFGVAVSAKEGSRR